MLISKNKWLLLIIALYLILALNYTVNVPVFEAPDEPDHYEYIKYLAENRSLPPLEAKISTAIHPPLYYFLSAIIYSPFSKYDTPVNITYNENFGLISKNRYFHQAENIMDHIPLYMVRLFSILLGMGTIIFGWKAAEECFEDNHYLTVISTALLAFIPQFIYISSVINCDNLANFISAVIFWLLMKMAREGQQNKREILFTGACLGLAVITKFTVLFLLPFIILALFIVRKDKIEYIRNVMIIIFMAGIISGWYYLRNYIIYNYALGGAFGYKRGLFSYYFIKPFANMMLLSFFGLYGWMNIVMDWAIYYFYIFFYGTGFSAALIFMARRASLINEFPKIKLYNWILFSGIMLSLATNIRYNMTHDDYQGRHMLTILAPFVILTVTGYYYIYRRIKEKYQLFIGERSKTIIILLLIFLLVYLNVFIVNVYIRPSFAGAFI